MKTTLLQPLQNPLRPCRHVLYRGQVSGILSQVGESTGGEVLSAAVHQRNWDGFQRKKFSL